MGEKFNIEAIIGKSVILVHDSLTWAERVAIGRDTSLKTIVTLSRFVKGKGIIHSSADDYSIKPLNIPEGIYILSTPVGGGGSAIRETDYHYKEYDQFLNSLGM